MSEVQRFDLMNAVKTDEAGHSVIYLVSRNLQRERRFHKIIDYTPHFWVVDPAGTEEDLFGNRIRLINTNLSGEVGKLVKQYGRENTCEGDILLPWRHNIDKGLKCSYSVDNGQLKPCENLDIPPHKGFFDLEVETPPEILARPSNPKWPIVSFQWSNNYTDDIVLFMLDTDVKLDTVIQVPDYFLGCTRAGRFTKVFKHRWGEETIHPIVYVFDKEKPMSYSALRWTAKKEFDAIGGWNSNLFDLPYWIRRNKVLGFESSALSPFGLVQCTPRPDPTSGKMRMDPYVKGVQLIDIMEMYKKWSGGRQPIVKGRPFGLTYDFHLVMEYECDFYYIDLGDAVASSRQYHPQDWAEYCTGDAFGLRLLDERKGIVKYFDRLRRIVGVPLEWAIHNSRTIDMRLLRLRDHPLPTRRLGKKERVTGAIVFLPEIGIHESVAYVDEKSLYPTLIRLYNLSPETLVLDKTKWQADDVVVGPMEDGTILHFMNPKRKKGIFPTAVEYDMEEREFYRRQLVSMSEKNPRYEETKMNETLHKFLSCSYYGVTGYENFRLANKWVRKAITFLGRESLEESSTDLKLAGYKRLYGDTDGLFVKLHTDLPGEGRIVEAIVNQTLRKIALRRGASFPVEAKYEHYCKRIIFVPKIERRKGEIVAAKKSYAYTDEKDQLFVVGLAPRRSSTAATTRELMLPWLEKVLIDKDVNGATDLVRHAWHNFSSYPANKIGMPRGVHKAQYKARNPWRVGMDYMTKRYGKVFREDKKPLLIWMIGSADLGGNDKSLVEKKGCDTDVICITERDIELPPELKPYVDWERMKKLVLKNRFKPLFDAIGVDWKSVQTNEIVKPQRQVKLG